MPHLFADLATAEPLLIRCSAAWAALAAEGPVPHGVPGGVGIIESLSETPMQDLPEDIADGIHVACVWLERKAFAGGSVLSNR